ncbi:uncharacterized protein LOC112569303 isoform X1 [Pomacea canaliculata]|uniref:uncharacterized protein LOC112569303 isoform X1 n=1 Tax=Pomacea canaliculata TaxID=400727 RepID=UPI000D73B4D0|nr:uncharacterized protein LOC112569303 isoform X1 [Pomacea canaliculata]
MVGGRLAKDWSGGKVELSLQKMLHLFVFVAVASDMANGQNAFNFNLSPSGAQERTLSPTTSVSVTCVWDVQQSITVGGVIDQTVILTPSSITQTNSGSQGQAVFVIAGSSLSLGEHTLVITATNGTALSAQVSTQATTATAAATTDVLKSTSIPSRVVSVSITVLLYNEEYLTGLALSSSRNFYEAVNTSATLTASVVQGTGLQTSWSTDNSLFVKVNVSSKTFSSPLQWTTLGRHSVSLNVSNRHGSLSAQTDVTVLYPINGVDFPTGQVTKAINEEVVLTLTTSNIILQPMGNVTYQLTWDTGITEVGDLNVTASQVRTFTHSYSVQGDRNVTLELTSPAQKKVFLVLVRIWDNLNVNLHLSATVGLPGDNFTLTFVNPPTAGFRYNISCSKPNYIFQNDQSALYANFSPPNPPFSVTFSAVGVYVFTFEAYNDLYSLTTTHHHH